jgi:hypothetical protein
LKGRVNPYKYPSIAIVFRKIPFQRRRPQTPVPADELPLEELLLAEDPGDEERPLADLIFPPSSSGGAILSISSPGMVLTQSLP